MTATGNICVFCGSSNADSTGSLFDLARQAGRLMFRPEKIRKIILCAARIIGLMGAVADAALCEGGRVVGVLPDFL